MPVDALSMQQLFVQIPLAARVTAGVKKLKGVIHKQWDYFSEQALGESKYFDARVSMDNFRLVYIRFTETLDLPTLEDFKNLYKRRLGGNISTPKSPVQVIAKKGRELNLDDDPDDA